MRPPGGPRGGYRPQERPSPPRRVPGLWYQQDFVGPADRSALLAWLAGIRPIWEDRYSERNRPATEAGPRRLLRPVYWLGSWQFACLDYYRPPHAAHDRCVRAEPFPAPLARMVAKIETRARGMFRGPDLPADWRLNTCLVNFYGDRLEDGKRVDCARVGDHRDFEPGPIASISLGERALFQFVGRGGGGGRGHGSPRPGAGKGPPGAAVLVQQWLDDGSLLLFGGDLLKRQALHRVQRVDRRAGARFDLHLPDFETRRVNFTLRYVPEADILPYASLPADAREDIRRYMTTLAASSPFFARELGRVN
ncbi:MAG: alpha-ketoglutarate-dependent dioxygenase AlkB [Planctomycetes bacterium]|nr:alpha-ketoglutarate-dependent dioxygenase AlkB [Planctomycetota bacterium]